MLTGKQRSYLKSLANTLKSTVIIGKNGLTENVFKQMDDQLTANELIKITVLDTNELSANEMVQDLLEDLNAEFVSQLGSKIVLYRESEDHIIALPTKAK